MPVIGIDIGNTTCKLAWRDGNAIRVASERMPENMTKDGEVASPETMSKFIQMMKKNAHIKGKDCSVVLDPSKAFFRHVTMPPLGESELLLNLPYEFRDFMTDDPEGYVYDYAVDEIKRDETGAPVKLELFAAAAPKALIEKYETMLRKSGFKLKYVVPAPMAYSCLIHENFAAHPELANQDVVLVDIGHEDVIVALFHGDKFDASRTIDFGCNELDEIIADLKGIDPYTAGSYKATNFEGVLDDPACIALCDRLAMEVAKVINFYNFNNPEREIGQLYFLGGGSSITQITNAITEAVSVPTADISVLLPPETEMNEDTQSCALAVAGLVEGEAM